EVSGPSEPGETRALLAELVVAIPGTDPDRPLGVIALGSFHAGAFAAEDAELVARLAGQLGEMLRRFATRLIDERRRMSLMVESMADGVIMTDERSEVFLINPAARRMLGVAREVAVTAKFLKERLGFYPFDLVARAYGAREELVV